VGGAIGPDVVIGQDDGEDTLVDQWRSVSLWLTRDLFSGGHSVSFTTTQITVLFTVISGVVSGFWRPWRVIVGEFERPDALPVTNQCKKRSAGPHPFFDHQQTPEGRDTSLSFMPARQLICITSGAFTELVV